MEDSFGHCFDRYFNYDNWYCKHIFKHISKFFFKKQKIHKIYKCRICNIKAYYAFSVIKVYFDDNFTINNIDNKDIICNEYVIKKIFRIN